MDVNLEVCVMSAFFGCNFLIGFNVLGLSLDPRSCRARQKLQAICADAQATIFVCVFRGGYVWRRAASRNSGKELLCLVQQPLRVFFVNPVWWKILVQFHVNSV